MKYWNNKGRFQELQDELYDMLVPDSGEADTLDGEALRAINRIYYDTFNNGCCNMYSNGELTKMYQGFFDIIELYTGKDLSKLNRMCRDIQCGYENWEAVGEELDYLLDRVLVKANKNVWRDAEIVYDDDGSAGFKTNGGEYWELSEFIRSNSDKECDGYAVISNSSAILIRLSTDGDSVSYKMTY